MKKEMRKIPTAGRVLLGLANIVTGILSAGLGYLFFIVAVFIGALVSIGSKEAGGEIIDNFVVILLYCTLILLVQVVNSVFIFIGKDLQLWRKIVILSLSGIATALIGACLIHLGVLIIPNISFDGSDVGGIIGLILVVIGLLSVVVTNVLTIVFTSLVKIRKRKEEIPVTNIEL